jgi:hypothetical protein
MSFEDKIKDEMKKLKVDDIGVVNSIHLKFNNPPKLEELADLMSKLWDAVEIGKHKTDILVKSTDPFGKSQFHQFIYKGK